MLCCCYSARPLYPSYFKLLARWLHVLTPVTYPCKLLGIHLFAAFLQLELFWVYFIFLPVWSVAPEGVTGDGDSFQISVEVAAQILPEMPLVPYNLSIECENVNTVIRDLQQG